MVEDSGPKESRKVGIVVIGPMQPVSRPKSSPPTEMRIQQRMYGAGRRMVIVFILSWLSRAIDICVGIVVASSNRRVRRISSPWSRSVIEGEGQTERYPSSSTLRTG